MIDKVPVGLESVSSGKIFIEQWLVTLAEIPQGPYHIYTFGYY